MAAMAAAPDPAPETAGPPEPGAVSAAPSVPARVVAFVAILAAGGAGGFIGWAITDLQCSGECGVAQGLGGLFGAVLGAVGVAVVVVLALRAMAEWRTIQDRDAAIPPAKVPDGGRRPDVRVR